MLKEYKCSKLFINFRYIFSFLESVNNRFIFNISIKLYEIQILFYKYFLWKNIVI